MVGRLLSRAEFLKLLGAAGVGLTLGGLGLLGSKPDKTGKNEILRSASGQATGSWALGWNATTIPIHATYLHNGFILYIAGSGFHSGHRLGPYEGRLLDPRTGFETDVPIDDDLFCNGSTILANGNVLIAGGTSAYDDNVNGNCNGKWHGISNAYEFDVQSGQLIEVQKMAAARWYPTLITLADGKVINFEGFDEFGSENRLVELYDPGTKTWTIKYVTNYSTRYCIGEGSEATCPGAGQVCFGGTAGNGVIPKIGTYPRMHMLANGMIAYAGMHAIVRVYNPATGVFSNNLASMSTYRHYGTSVLLPLENSASEKGKILAAGGSPDANSVASNSVDILDFNASSTIKPVVRAVQPLNFARKFSVPVILPDGKVVIFGGSSQNTRNYIKTPEVFDPVTETWALLPDAIVPRSYHSVGLLLSDGRVWLAGSTATKGDWELRTEFFSPWYISENRPTISGPPTVQGYGGTIGIPTPDAGNIQSVSLVRLMSATHHYEANQRFIWLGIVSRTSDSVTVSSPLNGNIAPPGYYMIHVLNSAGVPSEAKIIQFDGTDAPDTTGPGQVTGLTVSPGPGQLSLAWNNNPEPDLDHYNVHRSTGAGFVPDGTNLVAQPTAAAYIDTGLDSTTSYYYRVAAVDSAGNVGPMSAEATGSPQVPLVVIYDVPGPAASSAALYLGSSTRYGIEVRTAASSLAGKSVRKWKVYLRRARSPSGQVTAVIRRASDDAIVASFAGALDAAGLPTAFAPFEFTLDSPYAIQAGDRILIEYDGPARVDISQTSADAVDGNFTRRTRYAAGSYVGGNAQDIAGTLWS